ncbi:MAG: PAS domain S-box protein [Actinomycetota bacterium]|nr:PAS domain S-box protein [Actinomycetota bacterium]
MEDKHPSEANGFGADEELAAILMRHASDIVTIIGADGEVRYESPSTARILGFEAGDLVGRSVLDRLHPDDVEEGLEALGEVVSEPGVSAPLEFRWLHKDGSWRWLESVGNNLLDDPEVRGIISISRDVTARKEAEAKLRDAEERYRTLVEQIPAVTYIVVFDEGGGHPVEYVSPQVEAILGNTPESFLGDPGLAPVHPDDREKVAEAYRIHRENGSPLDEEYRIVSKGGGAKWVRNEAVMLRSESRGVWFSHGVFYDITKRKAAEGEIEKTREEYRMLVEEVPGVTYVADIATGEAVYMSPQIEDMLGLPRDIHEKDPLFWRKRVHPDDLERVVSAGALAEEDGAFSVEYRMRASDGRIVWVRDEGRVVRDEDGASLLWRGVVLDITRQKEAEARLHESEIRFRSAFENASAGVSINGLDRRYLSVNPAFCRMLGYTGEELTSLAAPDITHPDDLATGCERTRQMLSGEVESVNVEKRYMRKDGSIVWAISDVSLVRGSDGEPSHFVTHVQDITRRKEAERLLAESEEKHRTVVEASSEVIFQTDAAGRFSFLNPAWERVMGFAVEETLGKTFDEFIVESGFVCTGESGAPLTDFAEVGEGYEVALRTKGGEHRVFEAKFKVDVDGEGGHAGSSGVLHDITDRKMLEERLEYQALHDPLTDLPNRRLFMDRLGKALAGRGEGPVAVLFLDLDEFKSVNDCFGHEAGDALLAEVARRLEGSLRPEDTVARLGGEEFVVLLENVGREGAARIAERISGGMRPPFEIGGEAPAEITASIGASLGKPGEAKPDILLREADAAMYEAKRKSRDRFEFFEDMRSLRD